MAYQNKTPARAKGKFSTSNLKYIFGMTRATILSFYDVKKLSFIAKINLVVVFVHLPVLFKGLNENNGFRQTQTAFGIRYFVEQDLNFLDATLPISGPKSKIPMEFPLFQMLASGPARMFNDFDFAARLTGMASFIISIYLVWRVSKLLLGLGPARFAVIIYSLSPFALQWGASSMIEYLAVSMVLSAIWSLIHYLNHNTIINFFIFFISLTLALLIKVTTVVPWFILIFFLIIKYFSKTKSFLLLISISFSLLVFLIWLNWSDQTKRANEWWASGLTSEALRGWNFGTVKQRMDINYVYFVIEKLTGPIVGGIAILILLIIYAVRKSKNNLLLTILIMIIVSAPLIFLPLYRHDYYGAAISPALAFLAGSAIYDTFSRKKTQYIMVSFVILSSFFSSKGLEYLINYFQYPTQPTVSQQIQEFTDVDDVIMIRCGDDWSPEYLYYGMREGLMLRLPDIIPDQAEWGSKYHYLAFCSEADIDFSFIPKKVQLKQITSYLYEII